MSAYFSHAKLIVTDLRRQLSNPRPPHRRRTCLMTGLLLCGLAGPALAQLTPDDIEALRKQGEREGWTFIVGENDATHRPLSELCGLVEPAGWLEAARLAPPERPGLERDLPSAYDWREHNGCTPIRNQGGCGSCWAFAAIGTIESALLINDGLSENLSEQWLVSCTAAGSCSGGWHTSAYAYLCCQGTWTDPCGDCGPVRESSFPYVAWNAPCNCPYPHPYRVDSWSLIGSGIPPVDRIKQAILDYGPVSVTVYVNSAFQAYNGGVFNGCAEGQVNHAVVLVGWNDSLGSNGVWILRNSWGTGWGDHGYMLIGYDCSRVGGSACYVEYRFDCNNNGVRDDWDIAGGTSQDCNANNVPDECDIAAGTSQDCNENQIPDECDIAAQTSPDCNGNGVPDECELASPAGINVERTLVLLNAHHADITALVPNRFDFSEGQTGIAIEDGGNNMYDSGNTLNSALALQIPYTNGAIAPADGYFGPHSRYFTAKYPGMFVMLAHDMSSIGWFAVRGDLGADGLGRISEARFNTVVNGATYTVIGKRVYNTPTPSVNHIFIIPGDASYVTHWYSPDTDCDRDRLEGLATTNDFIYILVAQQDGAYLQDPDILNIANAFLANLDLPRRDCNANGVPDDCDLADQTSADCNSNDIPDECECLGDFDANWSIDLSDLALLLSHYGATGVTYLQGDIDYDTDVDLSDLSALLAAYGTTCD